MEMDAAFSLVNFPARKWAVILGTMLVMVIVLTGNVRYTAGDTRYSLLVSQSILENGTVALDAYTHELNITSTYDKEVWMIHHWGDNGHDYYFYPVGTPVLSLPFVWLARRFGMDMIYEEQESQLQILISAIIMGLIFLQLYRLGRLALSTYASVAFGLLMVLGTSLISTGGVALWSHNFETLFIISVLYDLFALSEGISKRFPVKRVGLMLFLAYFCRPTSMVFILGVLTWVALKHRDQLPKLLLWLLAPLGLFVLWSFWVFSRPVPVYYDPQSWPSNPNLFSEILPLWLSPARGVFIYVPLLLMAFVGFSVKSINRNLLWWMLWGWFILHTFTLARSPMPWGGWCFGGRFYMEFMPGLALMLVMILRQYDSLHRYVAKAFAPAFFVLAVWGMYINTVQGVYGGATYDWNGTPDIDKNWSEIRWDWRFPQFMANSTTNLRRQKQADLLPRVKLVAEYLPQGAHFLFGQKDPDLRSAFTYFNKHDLLGGKKVYNSLHAIEEDQVMSFWVGADLKAEVMKSADWSVDSIYKRPTFAEFLQKQDSNYVLVSGRDESSYQLSRDTRLYLRKLGSRIDSLKFRESYAAVFESGKLTWEDMGPKLVEYIWPKNPEVRIVSGGMDYGNISRLTVKGKDYSMNQRGLNVVVLNKKFEVLWVSNFDTHKEDAERLQFYKVDRKRGY